MFSGEARDLPSFTGNNFCHFVVFSFCVFPVASLLPLAPLSVAHCFQDLFFDNSKSYCMHFIWSSFASDKSEENKWMLNKVPKAACSCCSCGAACCCWDVDPILWTLLRESMAERAQLVCISSGSFPRISFFFLFLFLPSSFTLLFPFLKT